MPFVFLMGAVVGSFLNVCIHRIPIGVSLVSPPSSCPACGSRIRFYDNVPVLSYVFLRGRCRACGAGIPFKYPAVEAMGGISALALYLRFGLSAELFVHFAFISSLIVVTFIDLRHRIIPDVISIPGIAAGVAASFITASPGVFGSLAGAALGGGILLAVAWAYALATGVDGMGGGDVKLLAMIGAFTGWRGVIVSLFLGSFLGAVIGVVLMLALGKDRRYAIPFGPFLAAGAAFHVFSGPEVIGWYLGAFSPR
jgi:leader peptidase (prepilin peptidase)/N-methyltransferase